MISENSVQKLVSRALASAFRRTDRRLKRRNSRTEQLETRALLAVFTVSSTADTGAGSLRQAILDANGAAGADQIVFAPSTNGTEFDLGGTQFTITETLTITGNGAVNTVIDAQLNSRIFDIAFSAVNVSISGVTLKNGRVAGAGLQVGGAIQSLATGTLSISSSMLSENTVEDTTGTDAYGGAVFVQEGSLTVLGSTISGNTADWGGAIYATGGSDIAITSSTVDDNVASNDGGAVYAGFGGQGDVTITGSTLENNVSEKRGGAIRADNVTITGGSSVRLNSATTEGGAIHADGNVTVANSTVSENTSSTEGGAIHAGGNVTITSGSTINDNTATGKGGAIFSVGSTEVTNSTISGNSTTGGNARGGAIYTNSGAVTISQSTLSGNFTIGANSGGGAIFADSGAVAISQSTLSENSTAGVDSLGGAITARSGATISESTLSGNVTTGGNSGGGALAAATGGVFIIQSTLSGNSATGTSANGGAIYTVFASVTISQSTLTLNNAALSDGGAIFGFSSPVTITNSIVAGNSDNGTAPDVRKSSEGDALTVNTSLIGRNNGTNLTASATPDANGNLIGGDNAGAAIDPQLGPLANNGGPTQTHALLATSPAINKGSDALATGLTTDQRGNPFARIFDTTVDMGAYERQTLAASFFVVTTTSDELDYSNGVVSLREAINSANGSFGTNTITFAPSLFTSGPASIVLTSGELAITESVTINGPGQTQFSVNANQLSRVLNVIGGSQINVTLSDLTLIGGRTTSDNVSGETTHSGGGIRFDSTGTLTLTNSTISGNSTTGSRANGGGISTISGAVTLTNSTVSGNSTTGGAADGGGIYADSGAVTLTNSTVSGNSTAGSDAEGGGISARSGPVTLTNSTVSGNQVTGANIDFGNDGGGVWVDDSVLTIVNSTITSNSAKGAGGGLGMFVDGTDKKLTIHNSIIAGNTAGSNPDFTAPTNPTTNLEVRHSLIGRGEGTTLTASANPDSNGNLIGGDNTGAAINPLLAPLANNGGPTLTHALLINSPAFNRGNNALAAELTTDQRGAGFSRILFGIVDMGALESTVLDSPEGTTGADAFVLTYSATTIAGTVTVTISTNGGPATSLGTFPMNSPLTINGLGGTDSVQLVGTSGADNILVTSTGLTVNGSSLILTSIETRTMVGAAGDDSYRFDADKVLGTWTLSESGVGKDTIDLSPTTTLATALNLGLATIQVVNANLSLILGSTSVFDNAIGGSGADTLTGNSLSNRLLGGPGNDTLTGGAGSDTLEGGLNDDTYVFGTATAAEADQVLERANEGTDTLNFAKLNTDVIVSVGTLLTQSVHTNRTLKLNSSTTFENITGGSANDTLTGNAFSNQLIGGAGNDILIGGVGDDKLSGGLNDDTYRFATTTAPEADEITELTNQGTDTLDLSALATGVVVNLGTLSTQSVHTNRTLKLNSTNTFENVTGGSADDTLIGNSLDNTLNGGNGHNIIVGVDGADTLIGGTGRDILIGGRGLDTLNGGTNDDILIAGRTSNDTNTTNLNSLRTAWISANTYAARVASLRAGVGNPVVSLKAKSNVVNDAGEDDVLTGGTGTDWYFRAVDDAISDLFAGETIDVL